MQRLNMITIYNLHKLQYKQDLLKMPRLNSLGLDIECGLSMLKNKLTY